MTKLNKKHGVIAIVGAPNVGKSTLTNAIIEQKISITSPKVQTTRSSIRAIYNHDQSQIILIDTPGIFIPKKDKILERVIAKNAWQALRQSSHICFVIDAQNGLNHQNQQILNDLAKENIPTTILINKIDLVKKNKLLDIIANCSNLNFNDIIPVNATKSLKQDDNGIKILQKFLASKCQNPDWLYSEDQISDASIKFFSRRNYQRKTISKIRSRTTLFLMCKNRLFPTS